MKKMFCRVICAMALLIMFAAVASSEEISFKNAFAPAGSPGKWTGGWFTFETGRNGKCAAITNDKENTNNVLSIALPPDAVSGKKVLVSALVKAENISDKPNPWNGPKLMLVITPADGNVKYPAVDLLNGTYDWKRVYFVTVIPEKVKSVSLCIGLEMVRGKVWYDEIAVEPYDENNVKQFKAETVAVKLKKEDWNGSIMVDAAAELGAVNQLIFGNNILGVSTKSGPWPSSWGVNGGGVWDPQTRRPRTDALEYSKAMGIRILRYPGGEMVHSFRWQDAVGPVEKRPDYQFGIDELVTYCRTINAEVLMNVSEVKCSPEEAANLVEYCNAPADGKHPWADKRALWGHKEPYDIKYFELGNETYSLKKEFTAESYARWAVDCARRMHAVDHSIKISALLDGSDAWSKPVLSITKDDVDFVVDHHYPIGFWEEGSSLAEQTDLVVRACLAASDYYEKRFLAKRRAFIKEVTGRDIPLEITEYNVGCAQNKPLPYRFSFAGALFCGDYIRVMLKPENNVKCANYWLFINEYWGMLRSTASQSDLIAGKPSAWKRMPAFYVFQLWNQHFGKTLVASTADAPLVSFEGGTDIPAMKHPSLSTCASLSADKRKLYLIVFNKHSLNDIATTIRINGVVPAAVKVWKVDGELTANNLKEELVKEVVSGAPVALSGPGFTHKFTAHSMSAFEIDLK
ncbi:MAG: alpha-L-arabinofuranosidase C-terminal domain-containing protein [Victivallaceae bacterium]|jgi:alpha-L-arabinofuranosidase